MLDHTNVIQIPTDWHTSDVKMDHNANITAQLLSHSQHQ